MAILTYLLPAVTFASTAFGEFIAPQSFRIRLCIYSFYAKFLEIVGAHHWILMVPR